MTHTMFAYLHSLISPPANITTKEDLSDVEKLSEIFQRVEHVSTRAAVELAIESEGWTALCDKVGKTYQRARASRTEQDCAFKDQVDSLTAAGMRLDEKWRKEEEEGEGGH